jgi:RNA recognition motif-containing protein
LAISPARLPAAIFWSILHGQEGAFSALAVTDRVSGLCRGFGFVEMAEVSDVVVAFGLLNNSELQGR